MAKSSLTALSVNRLGAGNHADGGGLYLRVIGGSRTWSFRYRRAGKTHWVSLGRVIDYTLAEARQKARDCRRRLFEGVDIAAEAKAARMPARTGRTFDEVATLYIDSHRAGWKSAKHAAQWRATLAQHATALLTKPVDTIAVGDVLGILEPIWRVVPETASRLRGRIEAVLDYAAARHWRSGGNPARWKGHLDALLPARNKVAAIVHQPALPWADMPGTMATLRATGTTGARCVAFTILTAVRSAEAREATWDEIEGATWTIPAARMKAKREHRVPLSPAAVAILDDMRKSGGGWPNGFIFPGGRRGSPLSDVGVSKALHVAAGRRDVTVHGCRSSFRDWCAETGVPGDLAETALAHANKNRVEAAYARSDLLDRRRTLMADWASFCVLPRGGVGPIETPRADLVIC